MIKLSKLQCASAAALFIGAMAVTSAARADQVFNDDVIITGSLCVGFDCVSGMTFGADTIVLKENNLRIFFNDWRLIANDSASGGANFFAIEDATAGRNVFQVSAGAPSNSIFVASSGRVGFRTSTPVLDLHVRTGNTPGMRLEQDGSGGFSPQTWDIAGNEANFFVRDVTGGSHLPFRIRPGAPTSSIDISAAGHVGIGTASSSPSNKDTVTPKLVVSGNGTAGAAQIIRDTSVGGGGGILELSGTRGTGPTSYTILQNGDGAGTVVFSGADGSQYVVAALIQAQVDGTPGSNDMPGRLTFDTTADGAASPTERMRITSSGNVGIGTTGPTAQLHTTGTVRFAGVANCGSGIQTDGSGNLSCIVSSRRFKNIVGPLPYRVALTNVMALRPEFGAYKKTPDVPEHWLIAEDVAAVDPALAGFADGKPYTVKTQNVVADLVAVVQYQQREIDGLKRALAGKSKQ
jgi:hypothetical protein